MNPEFAVSSEANSSSSSMNPEFSVSGEATFSSTSMNPEFAVSATDKTKKSLDKLTASCKAQPDLHFHSFSYEELMKATNYLNPNHMISHFGFAVFYKGFFGNQPILIKKLRFDSCDLWPTEGIDYVNIRATIIASHLSSHGSSLKFIGSCHQLSSQVFEYQGNIKFLSDCLYGEEKTLSLPWRNRLSIAQDIAKALVILHNSFSTPVILRDLKPSNIVLDQFGAAKLIDFSLCKQIPEGESQVEDLVVGTYGYVEPQYGDTGVLTEKSDVFSFGVVVLELLTGQRALDAKDVSLQEWVEKSMKKGGLKKEVVDPRMAEGGFVEHEYQAFAVLGLRCTQESRKERPRMIDVVAELARIQKSSESYY